MSKTTAILLLIVIPSGLFAMPDPQPLARGDQLAILSVGAGFPGTRLISTGESRIGTFGPTGGAEYFYMLMPRFGIGLDGDYFASGTEDSSTFFPGYVTQLSMRQLTVLGLLRLNLLTRGPLLPYLAAGVGVSRLSVTGNITPSSGNAWFDTGTTETRSLFDQTSTALTYAAVAGIDVFITQRFFIGSEVRVEVIHNPQQLQISSDVSDAGCYWKSDTPVLKAEARFGVKF